MSINSELYDHVMEKLEFEPEINPSNVAISVDEGIVTVRGFVCSFHEKNAVERAINSISGVKGVANELTVSPEEAYRRNDTDIAKAVLETLKWNVSVPNEQIKIAVKDGRVTLSGDVNWWYQRKSAEDCILNLIGVIDVNNHIHVKPQIEAEDVKEKILNEFERNVQLDMDHIQVTTHDGQVTLMGSVHSWNESKEAERASWSVPGVNYVDNQLRITG